MPDREILEPANPKLNASRNLNLPHSPAVRAGDMIFMSGIVPIDPMTGELRLGTIEDETRTVLGNMKHLLESNGSSLSQVVKTNVFIHAISEMEAMDRAYREFFPVSPPARTVCGVQLSFGIKVEIECVALA